MCAWKHLQWQFCGLCPLTKPIIMAASFDRSPFGIWLNCNVYAMYYTYVYMCMYMIWVRTLFLFLSLSVLFVYMCVCAYIPKFKRNLRMENPIQNANASLHLHFICIISIMMSLKSDFLLSLFIILMIAAVRQPISTKTGWIEHQHAHA